MQVLALSSSRVGAGTYLSAAVPFIRKFLGDAPLQLAFIPYAAVDGDYEDYVAKVQDGLSSLPHTVVLATPANAKEIIESSDAIVVGGGNTFKLLHDIYGLGLYSLIRQKVKDGAPYIGWSAGANLAGATICTTNDMPIIQPPSFAAFQFLPFQINPHYYNVVIEGFHGETRDQRLTEFITLNASVPVIGLPEGTALQRKHEQLIFIGEQPAVLFEVGEDRKLLKKPVFSNHDLSALLR
jgi:dipeptidase E